MINFHTYKAEIKRALIDRKDKMDPFNYPNDCAWLTYALSKDGREDNPLFKDSLDSLLKWALSESSESQDRFLAPLSLCSYLIGDENQRALLIDKIVKKLDILLAKDIDKFSVINDPTQVFCITLGTKANLSVSQKNAIINLCDKNLDKGRPIRKVFYSASLVELGKKPSIQPNIDAIDPSDVISGIWFYERYKNFFDINTANLWKNFDNVKDTFTLEDFIKEDSSIRPLSNQDLTLLYEAVSNQAQKPDPAILFDVYPLHPRVKAISESLFKKSEYFNAVFEATKALNDFIRDLTGLPDSEIKLVQNVIGDPNAREIKSPKIRFNPLDPTSTDYKSQQNEQRGFSHIAHGIFFAFRHPKGHEPKDKDWGDISPYEALDQLVVISYLMKRFEEAK